MIESGKLFLSRLIAAWMVMRGHAIPIAIFEQDTTVVVLETDGSQVSYLSCRSYVESEEGYNVLLGKLILWICSHNRFFWTSDPLGNKIKEVAEEYFEEHKKTD